jgi:hypothetical protein
VEPPPRTYPVARPDNAKEPAPRTEAARALRQGTLTLQSWPQGRGAPRLRRNGRPFRHGEGAQTARSGGAGALRQRVLALHSQPHGRALRVCDEIVARFGTANEPKLRGLVAGALSSKGFLLCELDRKDEALAVCYEFLRYRFGEDNEPELRGMVEGILSAKKTSLASSRACPPAWDLPNELRNTAQPRPEILSGIRAPDLCSLLPPPYRKRPQQVLEL